MKCAICAWSPGLCTCETTDYKEFIQRLPGGRNLSWDFCNQAVKVQQDWYDEPVAVIVLCGRLTGHDGECNPTPPLSEV